jgi:hypothetical protein
MARPNVFLKLKKIALTITSIVCIVTWFGFGSLENSIFINSPRLPNPQEGRTMAYAIKGINIYITNCQRELLSWLFWIAIGSATIAVLIAVIHGGDPFKSKQ